MPRKSGQSNGTSIKWDKESRSVLGKVRIDNLLPKTVQAELPPAYQGINADLTWKVSEPQ